MKIILTSNVVRAVVSDDLLIAESVLGIYAPTIVEALNAKFCPSPDDDYLFKAVPDTYVLWRHGA